MTTYDFLSAKQMILSNVWTDSNFTWFNFWYELGKIMTRYDFLDARFVIWLAIDLLLLLVNIWFWAKNDKIWQPEARWMIFCNIRTDFNFIFGQFSVARELILNGGAIRPIGLLLIYIIANCLTSWYVLTWWQTYCSHIHFLTSWNVFDFITKCWHIFYFFTSWHVFDFMTNFLTS